MNTKRFSRWGRSLGAVMATIALAGASLGGAVPAQATDDGNWFASYFHLPEVQAQGITGEGAKIAVIDAFINKDIPNLAGTSLKVYPTPFCGSEIKPPGFSLDDVHGTNIVSLLIGNGSGPSQIKGIAPKASVTFYSTGSFDCEATGAEKDPVVLAIAQAVKDGNRIISVSQSAKAISDFGRDVIQKAQDSGIILVVSTPNSSAEMATNKFYSALPGVVAVGAFDSSGGLMGDGGPGAPPLINPVVDVVAPGVDIAGLGISGSWDNAGLLWGTSFATPMVAGVLADVWQKYPKATGNQLLQSLIRNTTGSDHALKRDSASGLGYGPVSLRHMLAKDPSQYPDVNPMTEGKLAAEAPVPTYSDPGTAGVSPSSSPASPAVAAASSDKGTSGSGAVGGLVLAVVAGVVVFFALVVVFSVVLVRRKKA